MQTDEWEKRFLAVLRNACFLSTFVIWNVLVAYIERKEVFGYGDLHHIYKFAYYTTEYQSTNTQTSGSILRGKRKRDPRRTLTTSAIQEA